MSYVTPVTPEAQLWNGYGTALKPAYEPIILAMNPVSGTFAQNALEYGVAGLNIDDTRIPTHDDLSGGTCGGIFGQYNEDGTRKKAIGSGGKGRFPANLIHDGSDEVMELFPNTKSGSHKPHIQGSRKGFNTCEVNTFDNTGDSGSAARFFYCAKASKSERGSGNTHPTVKPLALMTYLCRLVTYPRVNLIIDPFCGSGSTLLACISLNLPCIGIDNNEHSCEIAAHRCEAQKPT